MRSRNCLSSLLKSFPKCKIAGPLIQTVLVVYMLWPIYSCWTLECSQIYSTCQYHTLAGWNNYAVDAKACTSHMTSAYPGIQELSRVCLYLRSAIFVIISFTNMITNQCDKTRRGSVVRSYQELPSFLTNMLTHFARQKCQLTKLCSKEQEHLTGARI
jgi:hypothetical protein